MLLSTVCDQRFACSVRSTEKAADLIKRQATAAPLA
jgi:hypothetical protein